MYFNQLYSFLPCISYISYLLSIYIYYIYLSVLFGCDCLVYSLYLFLIKIPEKYPINNDKVQYKESHIYHTKYYTFMT